MTGAATEIGGHIVLRIGVFSCHLDTIVMTWIVMAVLVAVAILATRRLREVPSGLQNMVEFGVDALWRLVADNVPYKAQGCAPVIATLFLFILASNLIGVVPGMKSPTADINVTLALAAVVVGLTVYAGASANGIRGYLFSFIRPNPLFLPLNVIEICTRAITLALRLFGNIFAGDVLVIILGKLVAYAVPTVGQAFHVFVGVLQAYLFVMLSIAYISVAAGE